MVDFTKKKNLENSVIILPAPCKSFDFHQHYCHGSLTKPKSGWSSRHIAAIFTASKLILYCYFRGRKKHTKVVEYKKKTFVMKKSSFQTLKQEWMMKKDISRN